MTVQLHSRNLSLTENQKEYLQKKAEKILHFSRRAGDESSRIQVDVNEEKTEDKTKHMHCIVNVFVPKSTLHAESFAQTVEAAIDVCEEKLKHQMEKYKEKASK
ncbi:ribosome-associated translation inhibitor RaiA [Candidatus Peregrinibacteria bacterium]|nr:ribosome-associated translation inhibitor RaiA [Candidatus Peregrinibacteria bacterium]